MDMFAVSQAAAAAPVTTSTASHPPNGVSHPYGGFAAAAPTAAARGTVNCQSFNAKCAAAAAAAAASTADNGKAVGVLPRPSKNSRIG